MCLKAVVGSVISSSPTPSLFRHDKPGRKNVLVHPETRGPILDKVKLRLVRGRFRDNVQPKLPIKGSCLLSLVGRQGAGAKTRALPDGVYLRKLYRTVSTERRKAQVQGRSGDDAMGHVGNLGPWHVSHGVRYFGRRIGETLFFRSPCKVYHTFGGRAKGRRAASA